MSELMPHTGKVVDDLCVIKSMHTEAINHDPGITFFQSGHQQPGRPSIGAWLSYGLGSETEDLPSFVVLLSKNTFHQAQPLYDRLWGSGFLPSKYQGVKFRSQGDPVLYLNDPAQAGDNERRAMLNRLESLIACVLTRLATQRSLHESRSTKWPTACKPPCPSWSDLFPTSPRRAHSNSTATTQKQPGTHAANCLLARRLAERGVRFIQTLPSRLGSSQQRPASTCRCIARRRPTKAPPRWWPT